MKWVIYRYCIHGGIVLCFAFIAVGAAASLEWELVLTFVGGILSFIYFVQKQKLEKTRLFKELFVEYNERYDKLNSKLNNIMK